MERQGGGERISWLREFKDELLSDHTQTAAAALAFHALFGALPALAVAAALLGLLVDLEALRQPVAEDAETLLPQEASQLFVEFVTDIPEGFGFGVALIFNIVLALWATQRAASGLLTALNIVYDELERRSWWRREVVAICIALGGLLLLLLALALIALPLLTALLVGDPGDGLLRTLELARWPILLVLFTVALGLLYSYGPSREQPQHEWFGLGTLAATLSWAVASYLMSLYVSVAGGFGAFYGSLSGAVVVLLWFYIGALAVLAGAEINALKTERAQGSIDPGKEALRARERGPQRDD
ncbi:MAG: YihY/virulence factor BrkB family protein [Pseudomonadales bacterium]